MRFFILGGGALLLAACSPDPVPPQPVQPSPAAPTQSPDVASDILGLSTGEVIRRFGVPAFQVREGTGLKMQWRGAACILDAYLYPPVQGGGLERVLHVDTRTHSGASSSQPACIAALEAR